MATKTLDRLWALAKKVGRKSGKPARQVFNPIGLILVEPLAKDWHDCTPINASSFAHTGGDGVHYSLLHLNGQISDNSPVVMKEFNLVPWEHLEQRLDELQHQFLPLPESRSQ
jgi:hypothetical protein